MIIEATHETIGLVTPLLREMQADKRTLGRVDPVHFYFEWLHRINSGVGVMFLSLDENRMADGVLNGTLARDVVTGTKIFQTSTAYAKRGHAKAAMPMAMLRKAERWAKEHGAKVIFCGAVANDDRGTEGFLSRMGYRPSDRAFVKGL